MILVRYLSAALADIFISLSGIPSSPGTLFALNSYIPYLHLPLKQEVSQNSRSLVKHFLLWLQHWDGFCKF